MNQDSQGRIRIGCINIRGFTLGKFEDVCTELKDSDLDIIGLTETQLREVCARENESFRFIGKGRSKQVRQGGGVGLLVRKKVGLEVEEIEVGKCDMSEDIMSVRVEWREKNQKHSVVLVVCYMTVEGPMAGENDRKYELISELTSRFAQEGIIIMGDMNGHVGVLDEDVNGNGQRLLDFAEAERFEILNMTIGHEQATLSQNGRGYVVDYALVNDKARQNVVGMKVDDSGLYDINTDHNMIEVEFNRRGKPMSQPVRMSMRRKQWCLRKARWSEFQNILEELECPEERMNVDEMNDWVMREITNTAERTVGYAKARKQGTKIGGGKAWWNESIECKRKERKRLNKKCRQLRNEIAQGVEDAIDRYRDAWREYRDKQLEVKNCIRAAMCQEDKRVLSGMKDRGEIGGSKWFRYLRGEKINEGQNVNQLLVDGRVIKGEDSMRTAIEDYWRKIGGVHEQRIENERDVELELTMKDVQYVCEPPSYVEIERVVKRLKNDKATGCDNIPYEMFKNGGRRMIEILVQMFQNVWMSERVPRRWNESRIVLIHKGGYKSKIELKNYRPIALNDCISKIFCTILYERMRVGIENARVMGEEQNGFRENRRAEDNVFVIREVIERLKREGRRGYFAFIDIEKAYDTVDRNMLLRILNRIGINRKIVNIISSMYEDTKAMYQFGMIETGWVAISRGLRQGCILSPLLFGLYTEEMAVRVRNMNCGIGIGSDKLSMLMYADDIVIMSEDMNELQGMLDVVSGYGRDFGMTFSGDKSEVLIVNPGEVDEDRVWMLGGKTVKHTHEYKYLGVWLNREGCAKAKSGIVARANQWHGRLASAIRFRANRYEIIRVLWKTMAVSGIMYCMSVMPWTECELNKLEVIQNKVGRLALGAAKFAANEAIRGDMGWSTFVERLMKSCLMYKCRLDHMECSRWARKVYEWNNRTSKWDAMCVRAINKCGWQRVYIVSGLGVECGWKMVDQTGAGQNWDENQWKLKIGRKVKELGLAKWKAGMSEKTTLSLYRMKEKPGCETFYDGGWGSQLLFGARSQSLKLNARTARWNDRRSKACLVCDNGDDETVEHMVVNCNGYERERDEYMKVVISKYGREQFAAWTEQDDNGLAVFFRLLQGVDDECMDAMKDLLEKMWKKRETVLRQDQTGTG